MSDTFHRFSDLPKELRDIIWNLAIRPADPGVHFFSAYLNEGYWLYLDAPKCAPRTKNAKAGGSSEELVASWTRHNPSTYLIDAGLWTACKESRSVIQSKFKSQEWKAPQKGRCPSDCNAVCSLWHPSRQEEMLATGYFADENSVDRHFTVFPCWDLLVLQPQNIETKDLECIHFRKLMGSTSLGYGKHVALEFNPAWGAAIKKAELWDDEGLDIIWPLAKAAYDSYSMNTIWFIDYRIKRNQRVPTEKQVKKLDGKVFFGTNCRFVEAPMWSWTDDGTDSPWDDTYEGEDGISISCRDFVYKLDRRIMEILDDCLIGAYECLKERRRCAAAIGILACEYF